MGNDSKKNQGKDLATKSRDKKSADDDIDNYDEDFDDIEEDLPEGHNEDVYEQDGVGRSANNIGGSGQGITVSQSLGVDPSVDSLALEDYDYIEPVERA